MENSIKQIIINESKLCLIAARRRYENYNNPFSQWWLEYWTEEVKRLEELKESK